VGVAGYRVFRDGVRVGTSLQPGYVDPGLTAETTYTYTVTAWDADWYESAHSNEASATTLGPASTPTAASPTAPRATAAGR